MKNKKGLRREKIIKIKINKKRKNKRMLKRRRKQYKKGSISRRHMPEREETRTIRKGNWRKNKTKIKK
jgi:hypothetical protein